MALSKTKNWIILVRPWYWLPAMATASAGGLTVPNFASWTSWLLPALFAVGPGCCAFAETLDDLVDRDVDAISNQKRLFGLPLAGGSGAMDNGKTTVIEARAIMASSVTIGLIASSLISIQLVMVYMVGLVLATVYSLKPLRLKQRGVAGVCVQIVGYGPVAFHIGVIAAGGYISLHTLAISMLIGCWIGVVGITADILDRWDDMRNGVRTLVTRTNGRLMAQAIIFTSWCIFLVGTVITRMNSTVLQIVGAIIMVLLTIYGIRVWRYREDQLPTWVHGLAIVLEILFPFYVVSYW